MLLHPQPIRLKRPGGRASLQAKPGGPVLLHPTAYKAENVPEGVPLYRPSLEGRCSCPPQPIRLKRPRGRASLQAKLGGPVLLHPTAYKAENVPEGMPLYRPSLEGSPV